MDALRSLARGSTVLVAVYLVLRLGDVIYRGQADTALSFGFEARWFWLEILVGLVLPLALLLVPDVEQRKWGLFTAGLFVVVGIVLKRPNSPAVTKQSTTGE